MNPEWGVPPERTPGDPPPLADFRLWSMAARSGQPRSEEDQLLVAGAELRAGTPEFWCSLREHLKGISDALADTPLGNCCPGSVGSLIGERWWDSGLASVDTQGAIKALDAILAAQARRAEECRSWLDKLGYRFDEGSGHVKKIPGRHGASRKFFRTMVWRTFELLMAHRPKARHRRNDDSIRKAIALVLAPHFPESWLATGPKDRIGRAIDDGLQDRLKGSR